MSKPVQVFISYSHKDESFRQELETHLSALKRAGVIDTWSDRKIEPGDDWRPELDRALMEAKVVLLLVSSDFLASDFCYLVEAQNAFDRHRRGEAVVIPIILRDVDFRGVPIASLQALPANAVAVTSGQWSSRDEAWRNVAEGIRKSIELLLERLSESRELSRQGDVKFEQRYLDAAVAEEIPPDVPTEVVALVRIRGSAGLAALLPDARTTASGHSCCVGDVRSEPFEARFVTEHGKVPDGVSHRLSLNAPGLTVRDIDKEVLLDAGHDSAKVAFWVEADRPGDYSLRVDLFRGKYFAAGTVMKARTEGDVLPGGGGVGEALVASVKLFFRVAARAVAVAR